jgi:hypothetical protein
MSEMGEVWAEFRAFKQEKRRSNLANSTKLLEAAGVAFTSHNEGIHLVIQKDAETIDYWPSTGLWWIRGTRNKRRGVQRLIAYMKSTNRKENQ